jgi:hypothetical protein
MEFISPSDDTINVLYSLFGLFNDKYEKKKYDSELIVRFLEMTVGAKTITSITKPLMDYWQEDISPELSKANGIFETIYSKTTQ